MDLISIERAKAITQQRVSERFPSKSNPPVILDEETIELPFGWIFFYDGQGYIENGDITQMYIGQGPVIFDKNDCTLHFLGSGKKVEHYINEYMKEKGYKM